MGYSCRFRIVAAGNAMRGPYMRVDGVGLLPMPQPIASTRIGGLGHGVALAVIAGPDRPVTAKPGLRPDCSA
jgi:hypothetical protein